MYVDFVQLYIVGSIWWSNNRHSHSHYYEVINSKKGNDIIFLKLYQTLTEQVTFSEHLVRLYFRVAHSILTVFKVQAVYRCVIWEEKTSWWKTLITCITALFFVVFFSRLGASEKRLALKEEDCQRWARLCK